MNKEKRKQLLAPNQQTNIKNSQPQKGTSYVNKRSTKAFASKAQKLTTTSTRATFVYVGNQQFDRPAKSLTTSPNTTVSLGYEGDEARDYKYSHQSGSKLTTVSALNSKKHHSGKEIPGEGSKEARNNSSSTSTGINSASKRYATNNTERIKQSVTANGKSKVVGSFISKGNKRVETYPKEVHHGRRNSSSSDNFAGSSNNGSIFLSSSSNSTGRNRTGSFKVKRTAGKTSTEAVTPKIYPGKIEDMSVRGTTQAARKHLGSRFTIGSTSTLSDFQSSKTTLNNVYKRNHTTSSKLVIPQTSKSDGRKSMKKLVNEVSQHARENSGSQNITGSANTEHGSRLKTSESGIVLAHRPNANRRVVSSNYKSSDAKHKLNTVAKTTVSMSAAAANALLGLKQTETKASAERGTRQSTVSSSKGGSHVRSHAFGTSSGGYLSGLVDHNGSSSRQVGHNTSAGVITDIGSTRHRTYLAYNRSSWFGLGGALVDNRSKRSRNRYLVGSRKRRKKGRAIFRVRRIRRRRRKRRGRRKIAAQPQVEITRAHDKEQASSREKLVAGVQIRPIKTSSPVKQALQTRQHNARSHAAELSAVTSYVNRSRLQAHKPPKTTAPAVLPLEPPNARKPEASVAERITTPRKRPKELETHRPQNENTYALRQKNLETQEVHSHKVTSAQRKRPHLQIPPDGSAPAMLPNRNKAKQSRANEGPDLVRRHRKRHHAHRLPRCRRSPAALTGEAGNFVGGGLMWFPAASCVASGLDWNSVHSTACLHQQIAFVHRYKVLAPAFPSVNDSYTPEYCGSYVPWRHVTPDPVTE
ncbi:serine-rich adhesin for platelets-like [Dermacentor silvarum]|uniref:serine-rich adhesin for platelets-like n=1 Tax=Dermacentor silvarum TaxID=543639 RepID=UPI002101572B|nr:serine-rich adhesin for platelets-like [Dermacentor silvarum]